MQRARHVPAGWIMQLLEFVQGLNVRPVRMVRWVCFRPHKAMHFFNLLQFAKAFVRAWLQQLQ